MLQRVWAIVALIAMLLQTGLGLMPSGVAQKAQEFAHVVAHAQATSHHHHVDRSLHLEQTSSESAHQHADEGLQFAALLPDAAAALPDLRPMAVAWTANAALTTVFLEGPLRPPRATV